MQIPGYTIEREIGHGGMATVYLAVQNSLGRPVALKVMSSALAADRTFSERFIKEARTIALLSHPHIVSIYDVAVSEHTHYLALEYIGGGDLKARIRRGPMSPEMASRVLREIASALGYAHSKGFVHRDVKPENILFRENDVAVLTDFGIARAANGGTRMTGMGMSIGTPHYMSPEQARGKDVDGRADIYALGIVLYEMLTGTVPYDAEETLAIGIKHVTDPVPVLPHALSGHQALLDRMLAKDPNERFRTAEDLVIAIDAHTPNAKPRTSGSRPVPSTRLAPSGQPAATGSSAVRPSVGIKWALVGGIAALGIFGAVWVSQQGNRLASGGGGASAPASATPAPRVTDLESALTKPDGKTPKPVVGTIDGGYRFLGGDPSKQESWEPQGSPRAGDIDQGYTFIGGDPSDKNNWKKLRDLTEDEEKNIVWLNPKDKEDYAAWSSAEKAGSAAAYNKYLKAYPQGNFSNRAKTRLAKLKFAPSTAVPVDEASAWQWAEQINSRAAYERYLAEFPNGTYAALAKARMKRM